MNRLSKNSPNQIKLFVPNETDIIGAAIALMRLQDTYNLDVSMLSHGYLPGVPKFGSFTGESTRAILRQLSNTFYFQRKIASTLD